MANAIRVNVACIQCAAGGSDEERVIDTPFETKGVGAERRGDVFGRYDKPSPLAPPSRGRGKKTTPFASDG